MARTDERSLESIRVLNVLPPEVRRQLEGMCQIRRFGRGEIIVGHQEESREVFLITRGRVRVAIQAAGGREVAFDDLCAGAHFGEFAALDDQPRSAGVEALEPTTLACLSAPLFLDLCRRHPDLALAVMREMAEIARRVLDRVVSLSTLGAQNRVHAELLRLAEASDADGAPTIRPLPRHADLAARVSTTRETVARVLADLARQGIVERQDDALAVCDLERLAQMVEEVRAG